MRAGVAFASELAGSPRANEVRHITVNLFGSLGATGRGHSTDRAVLLGLGGHAPESVSIPEVESLLPTLASSGRLPVAGIGQVPFDMAKDMRFVPRTVLPYHVNALTINACDAAGETLLRRTYYSIGGGFVMEQTNDDPQAPQVRPLDRVKEDASPLALPHPFGKAMELLSACDRSGLSIAQLVYENEVAMRAEEEVDAYLDLVANTMFDCIDAGLQEHGILPGGLNVLRRAGTLAKRLRERETCQPRELPDSMEWAATYADPMRAMDWVNLYALAVNEENAAGHRVVTAPTNGAAGVIPAVIGFLTCYCPEAGVPFGMFTPLDQGGHFPFRLSPADREGNSAKRRQAVHRFLLAAAAVGSLIKTNASIAGAEVGCQGEVGSASAMAAARSIRDTGLLSEWDHRQLVATLTSRGFHTGEPGSALPYEKSRVFSTVLERLRAEGAAVADWAKGIGLRPDDVADFMFGQALRAAPDADAASPQDVSGGGAFPPARPSLRVVT